MYARTNYPQAEDLRIPTNYAGTALKEQVSEGADTKETAAYIEEVEKASADGTAECGSTPAPSRERKRPPFLASFFGDSASPLSTVLSSVPFFQRFYNGSKEKDAGAVLEAEDIWLLLLAAFLFFSDSGDKACALILIAVFLFA